MRKKLVRTTANVGVVVVAGALLAGCGAEEKMTFGATEVSGLSRTVEELDAAWASYRANNLTGSEIHEDSRCFLQAAGETLTDSALCGPIRYMASEATTWDSISLAVGNASDGASTVAYTGQFIGEAQPAPNAELFRTDGATLPENVELDEPDTTELQPLDTFVGSYPVKGSLEPLEIRTPDAVITVAQTDIGQRAGTAEDRVKAPEGHVIVSTTLTIGAASTWEDPDTQIDASEEGNEEVVTGAGTDLAFLVDGKEYLIGSASEAGPELSAAISVPGTGENTQLAITFDGRTQSVNLSDGSISDRIDALYDENSAVASADGQEIRHGDSTKSGVTAYVAFEAIRATRTVWDKDQGWAGDGKAWVKIPMDFRVASDLYFHDYEDIFNGSYYDDVKLRVASATVSVGGEAIQAASTGGEDPFTLMFAVPDDQDTMNLDLSFSLSGVLRDPDSTGPATVSLDLPARTIALDFTS
ncbi:hypothetical protein [Arthrobacter sp. NPDC092385]|uniref:hypothetical protein n=1 Tax=Arthrobacter sp. NPDC092385 TaxID=3363943 RepID=UPI0038004B45